ncbi:MAG: hypothetical protein IJ835_07985 [Muribaculaceae bacterium]|nr:hypothetical protein [Muribaculaceae bacterium]
MRKLALFILIFLPLVTVSCGGDEPNYSDQKLTIGAYYKIPGGSFGWTSDNEWIAGVTSYGLFALHVGETTIRKDDKHFRVTVTGRYHTYEEPYLFYGDSKTAVRKHMSGSTLISEDETLLLYQGKSPVMMVAYTFADGALKQSSVVISKADVSADELSKFIAERYIHVATDSQNNYVGYISADKHSVVILQEGTLYGKEVYMISYAKYNPSNAPAVEVKKQMRQQIPLVR